MDIREWNTVAQAIDAYRTCPDKAHLDALCAVLSERTLYVPAGDFDGNNAVISPLVSAQGGYFIPLYATEENVYPPQHSEGVSPADWRHILNQMPFVEGCVIEPYSVNFAFDARFIDTLTSFGAPASVDASLGLDANNAGGSLGNSEALAVPTDTAFTESSEASAPAWPPVTSSHADTVSHSVQQFGQQSTVGGFPPVNSAQSQPDFFETVPTSVFDTFSEVGDDAHKSNHQGRNDTMPAFLRRIFKR